jgi:hypothetical protein
MPAEKGRFGEFRLVHAQDKILSGIRSSCAGDAKEVE